MPSGDFHRNKTHCPAGHPYDEANTYWTKNRHKHMGRTCRECQKLRMQRKREKPGRRAYEAEKMRRWRAENPDRQSRPRRKFMALIQIYREKGCIGCGETHIACLDFHHRDPVSKEANVARMPDTWSLEKAQAEIAKCDVLCANCHRKLHWEARKKRGLV
jgi:hypothetical protein